MPRAIAAGVLAALACCPCHAQTATEGLSKVPWPLDLLEDRGIRREIEDAIDFLAQSSKKVRDHADELGNRIEAPAKRAHDKIAESLDQASRGLRRMLEHQVRRKGFDACSGFGRGPLMTKSALALAETRPTDSWWEASSSKRPNGKLVQTADSHIIVFHPHVWQARGKSRFRHGRGYLAIVLWHEWQHCVDGPLISGWKEHRKHIGIYKGQRVLGELLQRLWDKTGKKERDKWELGRVALKMPLECDGNIEKLVQKCPGRKSDRARAAKIEEIRRRESPWAPALDEPKRKPFTKRPKKRE